MKQIFGAFRRTSFGTLAALFLLTVVGVALPHRDAMAAGLVYRSLQLSSSVPSGGDNLGAGEVPAGPGTAANGDKVTHTYIFQVRTGTAIGSLTFSYCDSAFGYLEMGAGESCELNGSDLAGFTAVNAPDASVYKATPTLPSDTPDDISSWGSATTFGVNATNTKTNFLEVNAASAMTVAPGDFVKVVFTATNTKYFVNPSSTQTFFAHITTFSDTAAATLRDEGTVTSATTNTIAINTRVQESLKFSVEGESLETPDGPSLAEGTCDALTDSGDVIMGNRTNSNALSSDQTYDAYSYFRLATNSSKGAKVLYAGETLKSTAGDQITPLANSATDAATGQEQFGITVAQGFTATNSNGGNDVDTDTTGNELVVATPYDQGATGFTGNVANGKYAFDTNSNTTPTLLASSDGVVKCDTGVVRYIANISTDTPAGIYSTKISYIAVPSY